MFLGPGMSFFFLKCRSEYAWATSGLEGSAVFWGGDSHSSVAQKLDKASGWIAQVFKKIKNKK